MLGAFHCVGGPSVFYGGVSLRFRGRRTSSPIADIAGQLGAAWPLGYEELEPYYTEAERLLVCRGEAGTDPTEPPRQRALSAARRGPRPDLPPDRRTPRSALGLPPVPASAGHQPRRRPGSRACVACGTCDGFACAVSAKNDLATVADPARCSAAGSSSRPTLWSRRLLFRGRADHRGGVGDRRQRAPHRVPRARGYSSPRARSPHPTCCSPPGSSDSIRAATSSAATSCGTTTRSSSASFPGSPTRTAPSTSSSASTTSTSAIPSVSRAPRQARQPPAARDAARPVWCGPSSARCCRPCCGPVVEHLTGLSSSPRTSRSTPTGSRWTTGQRDRFGLPRRRATHRHTARDRPRARRSSRVAARSFERAGAWACYRHRIGTFSHAVGTVRMGTDPRTLGARCRLPVPRSRQSLRRGRQRHADLGRGEPQPHHRRHRAAAARALTPSPHEHALERRHRVAGRD